MGIFTGLFDLLAIPLGLLLGLIYKLIPDYFGAIFLFTLIVNILIFPLNLKSQKGQADRAKLAPRLERLKQKYGDNPQKFQEKQMALYEKEGVSLTSGCLPMLATMVVLFGIISVIYSPVKHLTNVPDAVVNTTISAMSYDYKGYNAETATEEQKAAYQEAKDKGLVDSTQFIGYYKELRLLQNIEKFEPQVKEKLLAMEGATAESVEDNYNTMVSIKEDFSFFGKSLLDNPWNEKGFAGINLLWLIPLISGITAMISSMISMRYTKQMTASETPQQGQGCSNVMMLVMMPLFSLYISFTVPGGVGVYWICSNLIGLVRTIILNTIYNPVKIREQAEREYEERRKQRQADKKRLAEARAREQKALEAEEQAKKAEEAKKNVKKKAEKPVEAPAESAGEQGETN